MNQSYARVNAPYATHKVFGVQLYKNNARALLLRILCILNSDWLRHARSVLGVYECKPVSCWNSIYRSILMCLFVILPTATSNKRHTSAPVNAARLAAAAAANNNASLSYLDAMYIFSHIFLHHSPLSIFQ